MSFIRQRFSKTLVSLALLPAMAMLICAYSESYASPEVNLQAANTELKNPVQAKNPIATPVSTLTFSSDYSNDEIQLNAPTASTTKTITVTNNSSDAVDLRPTFSNGQTSWLAGTVTLSGTCQLLPPNQQCTIIVNSADLPANSKGASTVLNIRDTQGDTLKRYNVSIDGGVTVEPDFLTHRYGAYEALRVTNRTSKTIIFGQPSSGRYWISYNGSFTRSTWLALFSPIGWLPTPPETRCLPGLNHGLEVGKSCIIWLHAIEQTTVSTKTIGVAIHYAPSGGKLTPSQSISVVSTTDLYAGGIFSSAGGKSANDIAKWNGSTWSTLAGGIHNTSNFPGPWIKALTRDTNGDIYAGGIFNSAGNNNANSVAEWNGSSWNALGKGIILGEVDALAIDAGGKLYAGGRFITAGGGIPACHVAQWNGSDWSALISDGGNGTNGQVRALKTDGLGNLYVGGGFTRAGNEKALNTAMWDIGAPSWSAVGSTNPHDWGFGGADAFATNGNGKVYAGAAFSTYYLGVSSRAGAWARASFSQPNSAVFALSMANGSHTLYLGGHFTNVGGAPLPNKHIAQLNTETGLLSGLGSGMNNSVYALTTDKAGDLYAGGRFTAAGGEPASHIAVWKWKWKDGKKYGNWYPLKKGISGDVNALAIGSAITVGS